MSQAARPPPGFHRSGSSTLSSTSRDLLGAVGSFPSTQNSASVASTPTATPPPPSVYMDPAAAASQPSQIYTAVYSGVPVYEMTVNNVAVMRRRADDWLNATQILKVAGIEKGKRTKVLEKEILPGEHEKVQGGYGKYQGTWINFDRGREFCRQYGVEEVLRPLLEYNPTQGGIDSTPTKEQAMAARRKRMYNTSLSQSNGSQGPFFSNISTAATSALAAINKVAGAHYDSNASRTSSARPTPNQSMIQPMSQETTFIPPSFTPQASFAATIPDSSFRGSPDEDRLNASVLEIESMARPEAPIDPTQVPTAARAIEILTSLFISPPLADYSNHVGLQQITEEEVDLPIDKMGHTAMHWAAALAMIPLIRTLVQKGASVVRVNYAGETPLIRGCLVTNSLENNSFSQLLELLHPGITIVDDSGRTVLHHIVLMSGIKGRSQAARYYLESLLEFLVRQGGSVPPSTVDTTRKSTPVSMLRFMLEILNAQDKSGDTALNIAARIGNKDIVSQLVEVKADPNLPNRAGLRPLDFGIGGDPVAPRRNTQPWQISQNVQQKREDIMSSITEIIANLDKDFQSEINTKQAEIDAVHGQLREASQASGEERKKLSALQHVMNDRKEMEQKKVNLARAINEENEKFAMTHAHLLHEGDKAYEPDLPFKINPEMVNGDFENLTSTQSQYLKTLPPSTVLKARVTAYERNQELLKNLATSLRNRSEDMESKFRKVVALCIGVDEMKVDSVLPGLLQAVESDPAGLDTARLNSFLRKVDEI